MKYKHIAVEGNIGAGKTTLTKFLSSILDASTLLEEFEDPKQKENLIEKFKMHHSENYRYEYLDEDNSPKDPKWACYLLDLIFQNSKK